MMSLIKMYISAVTIEAAHLFFIGNLYFCLMIPLVWFCFGECLHILMHRGGYKIWLAHTPEICYSVSVFAYVLLCFEISSLRSFFLTSSLDYLGDHRNISPI